MSWLEDANNMQLNVLLSSSNIGIYLAPVLTEHSANSEHSAWAAWCK